MNRPTSWIRRAAVGLAAVAVAAVALTGCGSAEPATKNEKTVAFVSTQKAGDNGPVDDMVAALGRLKKDFHVQTKYVELTDPSTYESTLRNLAQAGTNIIVTAFPGMQEPIQTVAPDYPDSDFVLIFGDAFSPKLKNAVSISYSIYQAMYVSGVAAANASSSGKIGYIGGAPQPPLNADYHAFSDGAKSVKPDIQVSGAFVGSFDDTAKGRDVAASMLATGVDVIQSDAAAASLGVLNAAKSANALVIADSSGETAAQYPQTAIGTTFLKFGDSLYAVVSTALKTGFTAGHQNSGISEGIVGLRLSEAFLTGGSPAAARVAKIEQTLKDAQAKIADGSIKVRFDPSNL